ncbi:unnamed protein product [Caenorhabditis angaria]|uniref:WAP domain-containing protein n=1 Tax=Caenorhabditis angaria TaxID=860376 RepID=A0A9P1IT72_9PELO|nr:unnamed protein product [Caenorhabditis angaria]
MRLRLIYFLSIYIIKVTSQWGWNNWNVPNNNLAIGYPTAYGLYAGRGHNGWGNEGGGNGHPGAGGGFGSPLRCLNGGAHIGQCRLDTDSICIALGGTCSHGACCTTPFVSLGLTTSTVSPRESVIDGEATEKKRKKVTRKLRRTTTMRPDEAGGGEEEDGDAWRSAELEEWNKLIEKARTTPSPILETSTTPLTVTPFTETPEPKVCDSGLRPVGPCSEDSDCPTLHQCENLQCCYLHF